MIGIDVVDIARLRAAVERSPGIEARLFTDTERRYCSARRDPIVHLAGTLAAKEAVVKAAALPGLWAAARRIEIRRGASGAPHVWLDAVPMDGLSISISHHGAVAVAVAIRYPPAIPPSGPAPLQPARDLRRPPRERRPASPRR